MGVGYSRKLIDEGMRLGRGGIPLVRVGDGGVVVETPLRFLDMVNCKEKRLKKYCFNISFYGLKKITLRMSLKPLT